MLEPEWPTNKDWQKGQSRQEYVNLRFYMLAGFTLTFLGVLLVLNIAKWREIEPALYGLQALNLASLDPILMLPGLLLMGLFGIPGVLKEFVRWRRQRGLVLHIDPVPASPDGELGGRITIPLHLTDQHKVRVTLSCMRRVVTKGKNSSVQDRLLWQTPAVTRQMRSIKGTRIEFVAELSGQQPVTSFEEGKREVWWAVHVEEEVSGFDAVFPVPVSENARKTTSEFRFTERERQQAAEASREPVRSWQQEALPGDGLNIEFPAGRSGKAAGILTLVGLVFTAVAGFMGYNVAQELSSANTSYFALMVQGMILMGFGLFGPALLFGGIYMRLNRLQLEVRPGELVTTRRFMGFSKQRHLAIDDIEGLAERIIGRVGQGVDSELEYAIDAYLKDGMRVRLGDGIEGQHEAEQLLQQLRDKTGIETRTDPDSYKLNRRTPPVWVMWLPAIFKTVSFIIFALTIAAFVFDFL